MKVQLKEVRASYFNGYEPTAPSGGGEKKYTCGFIFERDSAAKTAVQDAIVAEAKTKWPTSWEEVLRSLKAADKLCLHDGDAKSGNDAYKGKLYVNASNKVRPLVIGPDRSPLTAADGKPYSGAWVNAIIEVWCQDNAFGKRVNASLLGIQFVKDGERLAGGGIAAAADDFEAIPPAEGEKAAATGAGAAGLF